MTDPGLAFWLHHIEDSGGLWEPAGDGTLAILPPELAARYRLPEEIVVTDDPDIARADGHTFLGTGHPVLAEAAESVLRDGDVGVALLQRPAGPPPGQDVLEAHARAQVPVSHGRIDVAGPPNTTVHWVLRVGAMVSYAVSSDDHFTERVERWVHVADHREVPAGVVSLLARAAVTADTAVTADASVDAVPDGQLVTALAETDRLIAADALRRRTDLARQLRGSHDEERARATTYYADALAAIQRRLDTAPPDRRALLETRLASTREEQARRLAEIDEKYQAHHEITPYRLHAVAVPALRVPVDVRRGERRYRMELDWLLPARAFAQPRCPTCAAAAPLVAGKNALGCLRCQVTNTPTTPSTNSSAPAPRPKPAAHPQSQPAAPPADDPTRQPSHARSRPTANGRTPAVPPPAARSRAGTPARLPANVAPQRADGLAATVWNAIAAQRARSLRNALAADSPAAALCTVYGTDGIKLAIGLPASEELVRFTAGSARGSDGWGTTTGTVATRHAEYPYLLRWQEKGRALSVVEVLPFPTYADGRFHAYYWWLDHENPYRITQLPPPAARPDDVAQHILGTGAPWHGLAVAARALAAWWRLSEDHHGLLATYPAAVVAAAVHRLVCHRAGGKGLFRDTSEAYRADETTVRTADVQLRKLLGLGPDRAW